MKTLAITLKIFLLLTVLTGILYPVFITGAAQLLFADKANGSLVVQDNRVIGSSLIGQPFDSAVYFWPRPSATAFNPMPSGGTNLGPTSEKLKATVSQRKMQFAEANGLDSLAEIPAVMLFASGSGLDPHITKEAALLQLDRVAKARRLSTTEKQQLEQAITNLTGRRQLLWPGPERINVLLLNLYANRTK